MKKIIVKSGGKGAQAAKIAALKAAREKAAKKASQDKLNQLQPYQLKAKLIQTFPQYAKDIVDIHGASVHRILQLPKKQQIIALKQAIKNSKFSNVDTRPGWGTGVTQGMMTSTQATTTAAIKQANIVPFEKLSAQEKNIVQFMKMSGDEKGLAEFYQKKARQFSRQR